MSEELRKAYSKFGEAILEINAYVAHIVDEHEGLNRYSPQQLQTLRIIKENPAISQNEIAAIQGVFKTAISNRIKKLEQDGLIAIHSDQDMRKRAVSITQKGIGLLSTSENAIYENLNELLGAEFTSEEILTFTQQLDKVVLSLKKKKETEK